MSDGAGTVARSYDAEGRVLVEKKTVGGVSKQLSYTYNPDGTLTSVAYPGARTIEYSYSNARRPVSAMDFANNLNFALSANYAPHGPLASVSLGKATGFAGMTRTLSYNNRLQAARILAAGPSGSRLDSSYGYGSANNGRIHSVTNNLDSTRTQDFAYDALNRLASGSTQGTSGATCWGTSLGTTVTGTSCP